MIPKPIYPRFDRFLRGLQILNDYKPDVINFEPIPSSFPNGAPNHSFSAYCSLHIINWPVNDPDSKQLKELGFKEDDGAGDYWTFQ